MRLPYHVGDEGALGEGASSAGRGMVWMAREKGTRHPSGGAVQSHVGYRKGPDIPRERDSKESTDTGPVGDTQVWVIKDLTTQGESTA